MKLLKKLAAAFLTAAVAVTALAVGASAATNALDKAAETIKSGASVSGTLKVGTDGAKLYKITASCAGTLTIDMKFEGEEVAVALLDSETNIIKPSCVTQTEGNSLISENDIYGGGWSSVTGKYAGTAQYEVKKGKYYIILSRDDGFTGGAGKYTMKATAPVPEINYLSMSVKKGSKIAFGTVLSASTSSQITWTSSKSTVASVDKKGTVTAKAKGTVVVTAKLGKSVARIKITVT